MFDHTAHYQALRDSAAWAGERAATEMLIRGNWAQPGRPWINQDDRGTWISFWAIPDHVGALSGGERRFLLIAAALVENDHPVELGEALSGLDRRYGQLVLAAVAETLGLNDTEVTQIVATPEGLRLDRQTVAPAYAWPTEGAQA